MDGVNGMYPLRFRFILMTVVLSLEALGPGAGGHPPPAQPLPTQGNVSYGPHERQVLDFYQARTQLDQATPLLFFVHGGGWMTGDKANPDFLARCLDSGISVVSINYRFLPDATAAGVYPPVKACLDDTARALQFVRVKAPEWRIDPQRIAACGGSAGGFMALWLAFHPDRAEPGSSDPVAQQSTRVRCALAFVPQTTLDPKQVREWIPNSDYRLHAFGLANMEEFLTKRDELMPWINQFSPYALADAGDPPVLLFYDHPPALGQPSADPPHSANYGAGLVEKLKAVGVEHEINCNDDDSRMKYPDLFGFFLANLMGK